jgi:hypothetical protein
MVWKQVVTASITAGGPVDVRALASDLQLPTRTILRWATRAGVERPFPGVIVAPGWQMEGCAWAKAAVLYATGRTGHPSHDVAAVTRGSALALLGIMRSYPTRVEVVIPATRSVRARPRLTLVRSRLLRPSDVGERDGVPVVVGCPLLRDLAPVRDLAALRNVTIDLAKAGIVDLDDLPGFLAAQPTFPGKPRLRQVAADLLGVGRTDSPFELQVRERLADDDIPLDRGQVPIPTPMGIHVDLGIRAIRFGLECVSLAFHSTRADLERDAMRANEIASIPDDWRVLHATWSVLGEGWSRFVDLVREVIAAQSRRHLHQPWPGPEHLL